MQERCLIVPALHHPSTSSHLLLLGFSLIQAHAKSVPLAWYKYAKALLLTWRQNGVSGFNSPFRRLMIQPEFGPVIRNVRS